eukprot:5395697-Prymnesium_polylepis.1
MVTVTVTVCVHPGVQIAPTPAKGRSAIMPGKQRNAPPPPHVPASADTPSFSAPAAPQPGGPRGGADPQTGAGRHVPVHTH